MCSALALAEADPRKIPNEVRPDSIGQRIAQRNSKILKGRFYVNYTYKYIVITSGESKLSHILKIPTYYVVSLLT